ncbi:MAG: hypothetical protein RL301_766 [Actinomycetota bacterium]|jgi:uncharacterized protein (DUF2236 family)
MDLSSFPLTKPLANKFRETVSGSKDGAPIWVTEMETGDAGLFGPDSAVWQVHGCISTIVGGVRALLLQAAHPAALTGVAQNSRYETDPVGRLIGTTKWLTITTFGSTEAIEREARRVNEMHERVVGEFKNHDGQLEHYEAKNPKFLLWVHCAFTDAFLKSHIALGYKIDKGADQYIKEWAKSAIPLGLDHAPESLAEMEAELARFRKEELGRTEKTEDVVKFILRPPFSRAGLLFYSVMANAAIATLEDFDRELLGLKKRRKFWLKLARVLLEILSAILGHEPPAKKLARKRISGQSQI